MDKAKHSIEEIVKDLNNHLEVVSQSEHFKDILPKEFQFTEETVVGLKRLPGASNITYKVDFKVGDQNHTIVYRKFVNKLVDFRIENMIFQQLSDDKIGPYGFYQGGDYRIEEYLNSRTLNIFELRNPEIMRQIMDQFAKFHGEKPIQEGIMKILKENNPEVNPRTCLESFLDGWWKDIKDKIEIIRSKLTRSDYKEIFEEFCSVFYHENFEEYWRCLLPKDTDKIIAHTDAQETNILLIKSKPFDKQNIKVVLIDYEYAGLVERTWDLANYYTETMLSNCEYDSYPWVELFEDNKMSKHEIEMMVDYYIASVRKYTNGELILNKETILKEVKNLAIAINYYWGAWAMVSVELDSINDDDLYFPAAKHRLRLIQLIKEQEFV